MPVTLSAQLGSKEHSDSQLIKKILSMTNVAMPCIVQSFDPGSDNRPPTITALPAIKGSETDSAGNTVSNTLPLLVDVPVVFPSGGGCHMTFPIVAGDEVLVIFGDRCMDFWWQSGGVQEPVDQRMHDLSDGYAIPCLRSCARAIGAVSTDSVQLRSDDGAAYVEINPASHAVNVETSGSLTANATGGTTITSPTITLNGNVTINGNLSQGMGTDGGTATMLGPVNVTNDVKAGGKSLMTHTHSGVQTGSGNTGGPN